MGILDRVKNMFTEEVEESVREEKIEIEKQEELEETVLEEPKTIKLPEKQMPIFFDDQDFATLEKPKVREEKHPTVEEKYYTKKVETPEKKVFKLSPVISPVYGVLDKNYHKEDITPKRSTPKVTYYERESITIDEVRKKAYGTLEDELETSFTSEKKEGNDDVIGSRMQRKYQNEIMLEDLMDPAYNPNETIMKQQNRTDNDNLKILEPIALDDFLLSDDTDLEEDYSDPLDDTLTESDLFHLIDSMYDKEEE